MKKHLPKITAAGLPNPDHLVALCFTKKKIHYKNDVLLFDAFKEKPKKKLPKQGISQSQSHV